MEAGGSGREPLAASLARAHRAEALTRGDAVLVGDLAGVVEWTGEAWTRLTGFPLTETIAKPITHFLDRAGIEIALVEFVAQHFFEGRPCSVELPFDTFDGRRIAVRLEVEPLRNDDGEIERFVAVASEVGPQGASADREARGKRRLERHEHETRRQGLDAPCCSLDDTVREVLLGRSTDAWRSTHFELALGPVPAPVVADRSSLAALVSALLDVSRLECSSSPRYVTLLTGALTPQRSHHSQAHPIPARATARLEDPRAYLELHDTGPHWTCDALERVRRDEPAEAPRERALATAFRLARTIGATLHFDSTPGCGNQSLLVLPFAETRRIR